MKRITVFHGARDNFHQAVICEPSLEYFQSLGFVNNVNELSEETPEEGSYYEQELRDKIKVMGGKPGGRSSIKTLEKQLADLQNANSIKD